MECIRDAAGGTLVEMHWILCYCNRVQAGCKVATLHTAKELGILLDKGNLNLIY